MRTSRTPLALLLAVGLVATAATATAATAAPAAATDPAAFVGTVDIRVALNHFKDRGEEPRLFEALDVVVGDGPELTIADQVANPEGWRGGLVVDIDPVHRVIVVTADSSEPVSNFTHADIRIDSAELESVVLLQNEMGEYEAPVDQTFAEVTTTLTPGEGVELSWRAAEGELDFWTNGTSAFGYLTGDPFVDVDGAGPFAWYVSALAASGVASGYADGTFAPGAAVSRQAMAAFLFRASGEPGYVAPAVSPFVDVPTSSPFYTAVSWLAESGITTGTDTPAGLAFDPTQPVSRQAMAAFLFRAAGPEGYVAPEVSAFADVATSSAFYTEIAWLAQAGISTGTATDGGVLFRPGDAVSRQAMAAFLFRSGIVTSPVLDASARAASEPAGRAVERRTNS